jgi:hypothetical protein
VVVSCSQEWRAIRDNLRNFFLSPPTEMLSFLQQLRDDSYLSLSDLDLPGMQASATVQSRALLTCGRLRVRASEPFLSAGGSGNDTRACARCIVAAGPNVHSRSGSCSFDNRNSIERPCPGVREINPSFSSVRPSDGPTAP